ncbi:hypothetical protein Dimus_001917 [Dionaea muscipula]
MFAEAVKNSGCAEANAVCLNSYFISLSNHRQGNSSRAAVQHSPIPSSSTGWYILTLTIDSKFARSLWNSGWWVVFLQEEMDPTDPKYLEDEDSPKMKVFKGATSGLVAGTIWGTIVATWHDVPRVERSVALPGLIRTLKMMGNYGVTFAAIGGVYIGVEQVVQHYRMKKDFVNGAVGGFAAGATVFGYKAKSISTAISAGAALAVTSAIIDVGGQTTRVDNGKEYYPYTTKKRPAATES